MYLLGSRLVLLIFFADDHIMLNVKKGEVR